MRTEHLEIPVTHPVFAGHFPGHPLLPGSLLLDLILAAYGAPVAAVTSVKFHRPVLPGDALVLTFTPAGAGPAMRFHCARGLDTVCSGTLRLDPAAV